MKNFNFWNHPWSMSLTAAILLSISYPPFDFGILQIPAFILLFRVTVISSGIRQMILYTYPALALWNLLVTYWLMMATVSGGIAAILANALLMVIPLILIRKLFLSQLNPIMVSLVAAAVWVSYEFLHHNWDLAWPWLTLGNGWSNLTGATQFISVTGVFGISFWIVFTSPLLYKYLEEPVKPILYSGLLVFFAFPIFSVLATITVQQTESKPIEVAIIQPNFDSYQRFGGLSSLSEVTDKLLTLSAETITENTQLIIWPENAFDSSMPYQNQYFDRIQDSLRVWDTELITGSGFLEYFDDEEIRPAVVRESLDGRPFKIFNAAFHIRPESDHDIYRKGKLVPAVERLPFVEFFQKIDLFGWVNWGNLMGYGLGRDANNFRINSHKTPALICYDSVFPGWVNRFVDDGADFLTIITNDGWWGDSNGHIQHFAYARLRAIEQRRWIARSANNGISGIISPDGKVQMETEYWTEDAFTFTIYSNDRKTFYARHGEWFGQLMLFISAAGFLLYGFKRKNRGLK